MPASAEGVAGAAGQGRPVPGALQSEDDTVDTRPWLLFDLNGVLVEESKYEQRAAQQGATGGGRYPRRHFFARRDFRSRPGVASLLLLRERFRLGLYTSATPPTVSKALESLSRQLVLELREQPQRLRSLREESAAAAAARSGSAPAAAKAEGQGTGAQAAADPAEIDVGLEGEGAVGTGASREASAQPPAAAASSGGSDKAGDDIVGSGGAGGEQEQAAGPSSNAVSSNPDPDKGQDDGGRSGGSGAGGGGGRGGGGGGGPPSRVDARVLFLRILHRSHCAPDPSWRERPDGREWDTIKPLAVHGLPLERCLLVDNEARKSAPGEELNLLAIPTWEAAADRGVGVWLKLVSELLALPLQDPSLDVRRHSATITARLLPLHHPARVPPAPMLPENMASAPPPPPAQQQQQPTAAVTTPVMAAHQQGPEPQEGEAEPRELTRKEKKRALAAAMAAAAGCGDGRGSGGAPADTGLGADQRPLWVTAVAASSGCEAKRDAASGADAAAEAAPAEDDSADGPAAKRRRVPDAGGGAGAGDCGQQQASGKQHPAEWEAEILQLCAEYARGDDGCGAPVDKAWLRQMQSQWKKKLKRPDGCGSDPRFNMLLACAALAACAVTRGSAGHNEVVSMMIGRWGKHGGFSLGKLTAELASQALEACLQQGTIRTAPRPGPNFPPRYVASKEAAQGEAARRPEDSFPKAIALRRAQAKGQQRPQHPAPDRGAGEGEDGSGGAAAAPPAQPTSVSLLSPRSGCLAHLARQCVAAIVAMDGVGPTEVDLLARDLAPPLRVALCAQSLVPPCGWLAARGILRARHCPQAGVRYVVASLPHPAHAREALRSLAAGERYLEGSFGPSVERRWAASGGGAGSEGGGGDGGDGPGGQRQRQDGQQEQQQQQQQQQPKVQGAGNSKAPGAAAVPDAGADGAEHGAAAAAAAGGGGHKRPRADEGSPQLQPDPSLPGAAPLYGRPWALPVAQPPLVPASPSAAALQRADAAAAVAAAHRRPLSALHGEVVAFARHSAPREAELAALSRGLAAVQRVAAGIWPTARVVLFGSQAAGLALPGSDLDLVVLGVMPQLATPAEGFGVRAKQRAAQLLDTLARRLRAAGLIARHTLVRAKVPIVKTELLPLDEAGRPVGRRGGGQWGGPLAADISIGAANGVAAVALVQRAIAWLPPLRPLCLVVKALLKEAGLNEVFTGGLSSYSLVNMAVAHLQCEGYDASRMLHAAARSGAATGGGGGGDGGRSAGPPAKRRRRALDDDGFAGHGADGEEEEEDVEVVDAGEEWGEEEEEEPEWVGDDGSSSSDGERDCDTRSRGDTAAGAGAAAEAAEEEEDLIEDDPDLDVYFETDAELLDGVGSRGAAAAAADDLKTPAAPPGRRRGSDGGVGGGAGGLPRCGSAAAWHRLSDSGCGAGGGAAAAADSCDQELAVMAEAAAATAEAAAAIGGGGSSSRNHRAGGDGGGSDGDGGLPAAQLSYLRALGRQEVQGADLGELLHGFFVRYGLRFDPSCEAVSIMRGGVTAKLAAWRRNYHGRGRAADGGRPGQLLSVEDPQQLGKDVAGGSFNVGGVLARFASAARALAAAAAGPVAAPRHQVEAPSEWALWTTVLADGSQRSLGGDPTAGGGGGSGSAFPLLRAVLDPELALGRSPAMARIRARHAEQASAAARQHHGSAGPSFGPQDPHPAHGAEGRAEGKKPSKRERRRAKAEREGKGEAKKSKKERRRERQAAAASAAAALGEPLPAHKARKEAARARRREAAARGAQQQQQQQQQSGSQGGGAAQGQAATASQQASGSPHNRSGGTPSKKNRRKLAKTTRTDKSGASLGGVKAGRVTKKVQQVPKVVKISAKKARKAKKGAGSPGEATPGAAGEGPGQAGRGRKPRNRRAEGKHSGGKGSGKKRDRRGERRSSNGGGAGGDGGGGRGGWVMV